jgi:hypothetical protein
MSPRSTLEQLLDMETRFHAERDIISDEQCIQFNVNGDLHCTPVGYLFGGFSAAKAALILLHQLKLHLAGIQGSIQFSYPRGVRAGEKITFLGTENEVLGCVDEQVAISATAESLRSNSTGQTLLAQGLKLSEQFSGKSLKMLSENTLQYAPPSSGESDAAILFHTICAADAGTWILGQSAFPSCFFVTRALKMDFHSEPAAAEQQLRLVNLTCGNSSLKVNASLWSENRHFAGLEAILVNIDPVTCVKRDF